MIYKLKHPDPGKEGIIAGVDFCGGFGTTTSLEDAVRLKNICNCELTTLEGNQIQIIEERMAVKLPGSKQPITIGPVILRAVVMKEEQSGGGAAKEVVPPAIIPIIEPPPAEAAKVQASNFKRRVRAKK